MDLKAEGWASWRGVRSDVSWVDLMANWDARRVVCLAAEKVVD